MDFLKIRRFTYIFSIVTAGLALFFLVAKNFTYGIDFTGGMVISVKFNTNVSENDIRNALNSKKYGNIVVQRAGEEKDNLFIIKSKKTVEDVRKDTAAVSPVKAGASAVGAAKTNFIKNAPLETVINNTNTQGTNIGKFSIVDEIQNDLVVYFGKEKIKLPFERFDEVGPRIGSELRTTAMILILLSFIGILLYVAIRFQFKFGVTAIVALFHDVIILLGFFALLEKEVDLTFIAAILFIIGYSINDTIVVFDRIRENLKLMHGQPLYNIINISITSTLNRTITTSFITLMASLSLYIFGGHVIHDFAFAFVVGVIFGTYSSIYVASTLYYDWAMKPKKLKKA